MTDSQTRLDQLIAELLLRLERGEQVSLEDFLCGIPLRLWSCIGLCRI